MLTRVYFSRLVGRPVLTQEGDRIGTVEDGIVRLVDGLRPVLTGVLVRLAARNVFIPLGAQAQLTAGGVRLATTKLDVREFERRPGEVLLARDVKGRAVIDVGEARLVRVHDVVLEGTADGWQVVGIVPAPPRTLRGLLRQVSRQPVPAGEEIAWSRIEPLVSHVPTAKLRLPFRRLSTLRAADIADIVEDASHDEGAEILSAVGLDRALEADVFEEMSEEKQLEYLHARSNEEAATVLANMRPADAADILIKLDRERRKPILEGLPHDKQTKIRVLLGYGEGTAGGLMSNEFVALWEGETVQAALDHIRNLSEEPHVLPIIYTLDEQQLSGAVSLTRLVRANPQALLRDIAERNPIALYPHADIPSVAVEMENYNLPALPIVDERYAILGVVTYDDLIEVMLPNEWRRRGRPDRALRPKVVTAGEMERI